MLKIGSKTFDKLHKQVSDVLQLTKQTNQKQVKNKWYADIKSKEKQHIKNIIVNKYIIKF